MWDLRKRMRRIHHVNTHGSSINCRFIEGLVAETKLEIYGIQHAQNIYKEILALDPC